MTDESEQCARHDQAADTCTACLEEFTREEAEYRAFRLANPLLGDTPFDLADLPY